MAKIVIPSDPVKAAQQAIEHYTKLVNAGKNQSVDGEKDKKGVAEKRKKMAADLNTYMGLIEKVGSEIEIIPWGVEALDRASGIGGLAKGKMVELFGPESGGKSYMSYKAIASCQKIGGVAALLDIEQSFSPEWARTVGIDPAALVYYNEPLSMEHYLQLGSDLCFGGFIDLLVYDSTAAMVPQAELDGVVGQQELALQARLLSQAVRKIMAAASATGTGGKKTAVIWINQLREKPGVMFGNPETTPGGRALKFYCHQRLDIRRGKVERVEMGEDSIPISQHGYGTFVKNKLASPYVKFEFDIEFDSVFTNPLVMLAQLACEKKVFRKYKGAYRWYVDGEKKEETDAGDFIELAHWMHVRELPHLVAEQVIGVFEEDFIEPPEFLTEINNDMLPPLKVKDAEDGEEPPEELDEPDDNREEPEEE